MGFGHKNFALTGIMLLIFSSYVFAESIPPFPTAFYGTIDIDTSSAPIGTEIIAKINDVIKGNIITSESGLYGNHPISHLTVTGTVSDVNKTILFYIKAPAGTDYVKANENATFDSGVHELDLTAPGSCFDGIQNQGEGGIDCGGPCSSCAQGSPSPSGGGGGGGGGGSPPTDSDDTNEIFNIQIIDCKPNWSCSEWLECTNGIENRICIDLNKCGTEENKPETEKRCGSGLTSTENADTAGETLTTEGLPVTGLLADPVKNPVTFLIIVIVIIVILFILYKIRLSKKPQSKFMADFKSKKLNHKTLKFDKKAKNRKLTKKK